MITLRLCVFLLLAALGTAQARFTKTGDSSPSEPKLPVIDDKGCPGPCRRVEGLVEPTAVTIEESREALLHMEASAISADWTEVDPYLPELPWI
jgi:hypothetical protein